MKFRFKPLLISSMTLLIMQTVTAQPVSTYKSFTLEQGLTCLDWAKNEQSLSNSLALMGTEMKWPSGITSLQQQFQQQYRKQKSSVINDPDDENFCEDCPETEVYLPNSKSNPIKRIESLVHVSVAGAKTAIYRADDINTTKQKIEDGLNIQFSHYSEQQLKSFKQQWDKASMRDDQNRSKTHKVFRQYPHLKVFDGEVFHNQKVYTPKQIYIYSQPYKRDVSDSNDMIAFISLYDNPVNPSQHILQCGFIDNVF
ncbi:MULTISPECIES: hypothetical protein [Acinetobacter]|uniref:hypothetical protein n=1 Tax=Acinetobacter TaxID=469 RepID=UPI00124CB604|nr:MULTISPECIES: hypothetical protein [Acinetobacter]